MIKVLKASAGSGKTFNLAKEYISLLLSSNDPYAYRHILAVTFTNKATDEMKQRILEELDKLASSPEKSNYMAGLQKDTSKSEAELSTLSRKILCNILNDYGAFSISTIDRFFQRTLKAFSREIGQFASYQIELDKNSLVSESVDRILDSLTEDNKSLLNWLTDSVKEQLVTGGKFSLDSGLNNIAVALMNDEYREAVKTYNLDESKAYEKERLSKLKETCAGIMSDYVKDLKSKASEILDCLGKAGISPEDFKGGSKSFMRQLYTYSDIKSGDKIAMIKDTFVTNAHEPDKWFAKTKAHLLPSVEPLIEKPLLDFCEMFKDRYVEYNTAKLIKEQTYSLGLAREIRKSFDELVREKNVMSLDDSNTVLHDIIDGSDAPFIYEKTGTRYDHFLLDEFQDTSCIQWDNFRPLLADSEASGNENLIVGDVKQSIYRWRNSDWNLLNSTVKEQFPTAEESALQSNWRSTASVVNFNNKFYGYAAKAIDRAFGAEKHPVEGIYSDVEQQVGKSLPMPGNVDVLFCNKVEGRSNSEVQIQSVLDEINRVRAAGASYSDIGILVRTNAVGSNVANALLENGVPVVSDDSLTVKSSPSVRRLVALLSYADDSDDKLNSFLASSLGIAPPAEWHSLIDLCEYFIRRMKENMNFDFEGEVAYLQAFMDTVQEWSQSNGNSLSEFLSYWDKADPKICSPKDSDAVQVMTLHKSKGLSFPYVIFPFAEDVSLYKATTRWCRPHTEKTALENASEGLYMINLSSETENTLFCEDFRKESFMQAVDAINMFYVATTRAEKGMTIIAQMPSATFRDALVNGEDANFKNMSQILYVYLMQSGSETGFSDVEAHGKDDEGCFSADDMRFSNGDVYDFKMKKESEKKDENNDHKKPVSVERFGYPSFALNPEAEVAADAAACATADATAEAAACETADTTVGAAADVAADATLNQNDRNPDTEQESKIRLKFSSEASDFFSGDGSTGIEASGRLKGIVLHNILSKVAVPEDLENAIAESYNAGEIDDVERDEITKLLSARVADARSRGWFPEEKGCVFNETSVIDINGETHRPDRVIVDGKKAVIVDYKFGHFYGEYAENQRESYKTQIREYADLYRQAGYEDVSCYLWYVMSDKVVEG